MEPDPDTYPTPEDDADLFEAYDEMADVGMDDDQPDDGEWRPGTCDMCSGHTGGQDEIKAAMASAIVPVCACATGQGAYFTECQCGPERAA